MPGITDYASLKTEVAAWMHRRDLTDRIPVAIQMAETVMNGAYDPASPKPSGLRVQRMVQRAYPTAGAEAEYLALPTNTTSAAAPTRVLDLIEVRISACQTELPVQNDHTIAIAKTRRRPQPKKPECCAIVGNSLRLFPAPDQDYDLALTYFGWIPSLSDSQTTNWVLTDFPNAYLYGALWKLAPYARDREIAATWESEFFQALAAIRSADPVQTNARLAVDAALMPRRSHRYNINTG